MAPSQAKTNPASAPTSRRAPLAEPPLRAWRALFTTQLRTKREVERRLAEAGLPPMRWYDVLYTVYLAPEQHLTQHEIANEIVVSPSALSRLLDRMEDRSVIGRQACPGDRRALNIVLTEQGIELMRRIWSVYAAVLAEHFAPPVRGLEEEIAEALEAVTRSLEANCPS